MAEAEKKETPSPASGNAKSAKPALGKASEANDPVVHQLLAEQEIHLRNDDQKAADAITAQLNELGYE